MDLKNKEPFTTAQTMRPTFRDFEHAGWERVATKYESAWAELTRQFIVPLLTAAGVEPGMQVLDLACGPGYVAAAARSMGADAVGVDFSGEMIKLARKQFRGIDFHEGDSERLAFADGTFDRVLINFGVLHFALPEKAFAEARRVLRREGRFGFTVWAEPKNNPGGQLLTKAIEAYADMDIPLPEGPPYFLFSDPNGCRKMLTAAGFLGGSMTFDLVQVKWLVPTAAYFFEAERDAGVRTAALLAHQSPDRLAAIRSAVVKAVEQYQTAEGFSIPMAAYVVAATAC